MSSHVAPAVLRCELCDKPFDKQSSLTRHGYYCRSRRGHPKSSRARSCMGCAKAKARCDKRYSQCKRCITKGMECREQTTSENRISRSTTASKEDARERKACDEPFPDFPSAAHAHSMTTDCTNLLVAYDAAAMCLDLPDIIQQDQVWRAEDIQVPQIDDIGSQADTRIEDPPASSELVSMSNIELANNQMGYYQISSIPTMPSLALRSFGQNPRINDGARTTAMLMMQTLMSYPMMLRSQDMMPPFIHPYSLKEVEDEAMESLATCMSLLQVLRTRTPGSKRLFWRNVRLECERFYEQWAGMNRWELMGSLQALLVYILLRLQEGENPHNNFDVLILSALSVTACGLQQMIGPVLCVSPCGLSHGLSMEDWIFEESRRRLSVAFRAISLLFSIEPAGHCLLADGFLISPLPTRKQLWEARDEGEWAAERSLDSGISNVFGLKVDGNLVRLSQYKTLTSGETVLIAPESPGENDENWQDWCTGMDGLGALVMLAAVLPVPSSS